jgi:hypothetical protein
MLQKEFPNGVVKESVFRFGIDSVKSFLSQHAIESHHHVIFDELICNDFSKRFVDSILAIKSRVASLWIAMGCVPLLGSFSTEKLEEAGFVCPKLSFALRNPLQVSSYAQEIVQNRAKNLLFSVLTSPIEVDRFETNIPDGQVIKINNSQLSFLCAFNAAIEKIPALTFALFFIDNSSILNLDGSIEEAFLSRQEPYVFKSINGTHMLKNWLCDPKSRKNDVCIIGRDHQCNGIEVEIVVHILPADCPSCGISNSDPVIVSRAKAMVITSTYQRSQCSCGWKNDPTINDCGWNTLDHIHGQIPQDHRLQHRTDQGCSNHSH